VRDCWNLVYIGPAQYSFSEFLINPRGPLSPFTQCNTPKI
jgi:hypothetical protein